MTNKKSSEIWKEVRGKTVGCYEDAFGNCSCDYGCPCDKCSAEWVQEVYRKALEEAGEPPEVKKFTVLIRDTITYYDIEAETKEEAVEIALEWWNERKPYYEVEEEEE